MGILKDKIMKYLKDISLESAISDALKDLEELEETNNTTDTAVKDEVTIEPNLKDEFIKEFDKLNSDLAGKKNEVVLDKLEYTPLTDEEINKLAESGVDKKYEIKIESLEDSLNKAIENVNLNNQKLKDESLSKKSAIDELYDEASKNVENNALKRGIARSSIVSEQLKSLDVSKIKDLLSVDDKLANDLKENALKIDSLQDEYQKAVKTLNIEKVLEIDDNIKKLKKEQEDKITEVLKYNNTIKKQQMEMDKAVEKPTQEEQDEIKKQMFNVALNYYMSIPKEQALKEFDEDENVRKSLGSYAEAIKNYLKART